MVLLALTMLNIADTQVQVTHKPTRDPIER